MSFEDRALQMAADTLPPHNYAEIPSERKQFAPPAPPSTITTALAAIAASAKARRAASLSNEVNAGKNGLRSRTPSESTASEESSRQASENSQIEIKNLARIARADLHSRIRNDWTFEWPRPTEMESAERAGSQKEHHPEKQEETDWDEHDHHEEDDDSEVDLEEDYTKNLEWREREWDSASSSSTSTSATPTLLQPPPPASDPTRHLPHIDFSSWLSHKREKRSSVGSANNISHTRTVSANNNNILNPSTPTSASILSGMMAKESSSSDPYRFASPDAVGLTIQASIAAKRRKRREALEEEMAWNEGLRYWQAQRDAWTGTKLVPLPSKIGGNITADGIQNGASIDPSATRSNDLQDLRELTPLYRRLLPDSPTRASITPATFPLIYSKVVIKSLTPTLPINLSDMVSALVQGWKDEGEWPPKAAPPDPLAGRRRRMLGLVAGRGVGKKGMAVAGITSSDIGPPVSAIVPVEGERKRRSLTAVRRVFGFRDPDNGVTVNAGEGGSGSNNGTGADAAEGELEATLQLDTEEKDEGSTLLYG